jgi:hypothetical protein
MDIIKKNLVSIICGVIILMAIVALFWPINGYYKQLQATATARKSVYQTLKSLLEKPRQLPIVSLDSTDPQPLGQFPTTLVIQQGTAVTQQVHAESDAILAAAIKMNQHEPLISDVLPQGPTSSAIAFRDQYKSYVNYLNSDTRANSFPIRIMNAGFPPTDLEIQAKLADVGQQIKAKTQFSGTGQAMNQPAIDAELAATMPKVPDQLKLQAAQNCKVYIDPTTFEPYTPIVAGNFGAPPEPSTIFAAQVQLWVQEDIAKSIAAVNQDAHNVMESPVKHLLEVRVLDTMGGTPPAAAAGAADAGADLTGTLPKNYAFSPTGRASNAVYDVIPIMLTMDVDAEQIPRVLQELSRNKFITVTNCSIQSVDTGLLQAMGYYYGTKPVVELNLQCEELLLRKWTEPLMPLHIKEVLGIVAPEQPLQQQQQQQQRPGQPGFDPNNG